MSLLFPNGTEVQLVISFYASNISINVCALAFMSCGNESKLW